MTEIFPPYEGGLPHPSSTKLIYAHNPTIKSEHPIFTPQNPPKSNDSSDLYILARAYSELNQKFQALEHENKILKSQIVEFENREQQQKLIMKAQEEAHQQNLRLMLPGEKEIEDLKARIQELEKERNVTLLPTIESWKKKFENNVQNHSQIDKEIASLEDKIKDLKLELEREKAKSHMTISVQEESNTRLRRKNAQLFSKLMRKQLDIEDEKKKKNDDKSTILRLEEQLDRYQHWNDHFKDLINQETHNLLNAKHKSLKLDNMLKYEWLNAHEREKLISELTDENLYLRHANRLLQDQLDAPVKPIDKSIEMLFYKNVKDQLSTMEEYLQLKPVKGDKWTERGTVPYVKSESKRRAQQKAVKEYLETIDEFLASNPQVENEESEN